MSNENAAAGIPPKILRAHYDHVAGCYYVNDAWGGYIRNKEGDLVLRLRAAGLSTKSPDGAALSPVEVRILEIQNTESIAYAGPLAGFAKGVHTILGQRILVTTSPVPIGPKPGEWCVLQQLLKNLFGEQVVYVYGWLKYAVECLQLGKLAPGQALCIIGEHAAGKSLVQNLITLILGGRSAKPYRYMSGATTFNSELFGAEHLMIEDEPASRDLRTRKKFGAEIKLMIASETQSCHPKGRPAISLTPFWRLTISLNPEPESLLTLPPLDDSLEDKIILLRAAKQPMPMPTSGLRDREIFWKRLVDELPAFVNFLLNWPIPEALKSQRFGITHYHDPEVRKAIDTLAPETRLLELIDATIFTVQKTNWTGSAAELEEALAGSDKAYEARVLFDFASAAGTYLGRLALSNPKRVEKLTTGNGNRWLIHPPEQ